MKATKKPVEIDFCPNPMDLQELKDFVLSFNEVFEEHFIEDSGILRVKTLEGTSYDVTNDDVIIRGVSGEYYPCKKDIFDLTYDY